MKKIISLFIITVLVNSNTNTVNAQVLKLAASVSKEKATQKLMVKMKFIDTVNVVSNYHINVFRKEGNGDWIKITTEPIAKTPVTTSDNVNAKDPSFKRYANFVLRKQNDAKEKNVKGFAGLLLLNDNKMAEYAGCYFEDKNIVTGKTYEYKLTDADKNDADLSRSIKINTALTNQPAVTNLSSAQHQQNILLNWKKEEQHYAYKIYRKNANATAPVLLTVKPMIAASVKGKNNNSFTYIDTGLKAGSIYYYQVAALDVLNNETALSEPLKVVVKDLTLPKTVTGLTNERKKKTFQLTWETVKEKNCSGYNIYRANEGDSTFKKINKQLLAVNTSSFIDSTVTEKKVYNYYVESISNTGITAKSLITMAVMPDVTPPAKPTGVKGTAAPGVTNITWSPNKEADVKGYWVYRSTNKNKDYFNLITEKPITATSFTDSLPVNSKNDYVYSIQAVDDSYNKSEMSDTVIVLLPDVTPPLAIQNVEAQLIEKEVALSWQASADNDVIGYNIFRATDTANTKFEKLNKQPLTQTSFKDKDLSLQGTTIAYYITAIDKSNNVSEPSKPAYLVIAIDTAFMKNAEAVSVSKDATDSSIHITWRSAAQNVSGFIVFRKSNNQENFTAISPLLMGTNFKDETPQPGEVYEYYIRIHFTNNSFKNSVVSK